MVNGYYNGSRFYHFSSIKKFLDFLEMIPDPVESIFSHFGGGYDMLFVMDTALRAGYDITDIIMRGGNFLCFTLHLENGNTIVFRDSAAILPFSLKKLAADFGVKTQKGEIDYSRIRKITPKLLKYLESDCRALYECLEAYFKTPLIEKAGVAYTSASQALKIFSCYLPTTIHSNSQEADTFVRKGYVGGRVEIFRPYFKAKGSERLHCFDVNSLYPSVMLENEFPVIEGEFTERRKKGTMYFADVTVEVPEMYIPPLPYKCPKRRKLIFPTGIFRSVYSSIELEYAEKLGVKVKKIHEVLTCKSGGKIFSEFIRDLYKIREENARGSVLNFAAKTAMNSLYGRIGLNKEKDEIKIMESLEDYDTMEEYRRINFGSREIKFMRKEKTLDSFSCVMIAAWVTSHARVKMHKLLREHEKEIFYIDTDSLFTLKKVETSEKLGGLKHEYSLREACFLLPKTYAVTFDRAIKGKRKKIVMKGFEMKKLGKISMPAFQAALEGDLTRLKISTQPTHLKFRSALKQGKILKLGKKSVKRIKSRYDKREIIPIGGKFRWDTSPWKITNERKNNG